MADQKGPSWKNPTAGGGGGGGGTRQPAQKSHKAWQPSGKAAAKGPADPKARFRKRLLAAAVTGAVLIAGVVIVISLLKPPKHPALTAVAPDTSATISSPANVYAANGVKGLAEWAGQAKDRPRLIGDAAVTSRDGWQAPLGKIAEKGVILYFAAPGAADKNGPYLWMTPGDAAGIDDKQKLPVKEILQRLGELPADKQKLLLFDAALMPADWAHGYLHNDFARSLKTLDAEIEKVPNLVVICSSDDDQRSWASDEWRQTIFGHFVNQAVRGGAGPDNPRVTAAVLFDYLKKEVGAWARANRDAEQTPIMLPSKNGKELAEKFEIVSIDPSGYQAPSAATAPGANLSIPDSLRSAWTAADQLAQRNPPPETVAPQLWRSYLDSLLRWEQLVRVGANPEAIQRQAEALARELQQLADLDLPCLPNSLAVAPAFGLAPVELENAKFNEIWSPLPGKKPEDVWSELRQAARAKDSERGVTLLRMQAARKVLERMQQPENGPTAENLKLAREALAVIDESQPRPIETHFLLMLQRDLDPAKRPDQEMLKKALLVRAEAERIAWSIGGSGYAYADQTYRWIERSLRQADRQRRLAEDLLFAVDSTSWGKAAAAFKTAEESYAKCAQDASTAAEASRTRDRAFARLPYFARWMAAYRGDLPEGEVERLLKLVEKMANDAHQLAEKLDTVPDDPNGALADLKTLTGGMKADFTELQRVFDADTGNLGGTVLPSKWHAIDNALSVPFLPVDRRMKLLADLLSISHQLNVKSQTPSSSAPASGPNAQDMAKRQGRMALAILGERWVEDADMRSRAARGATMLHFGELKQRIERPMAGAWWESLREVGEQVGGHFRDMVPAINVDLEEAGQVELKQVPKFLAHASYLARLLDSATPITRDKNPAADERRYWTHEMLLWQARRSTDDGWASLVPPVPPSRQYCEEAAERYALSAEKLILGNNPSFETRERNRRLADVKIVRDQIKAPAFEILWQKVVDVTEDRDWQVNMKITPAAGQAVTYPMLRLNPVKTPIRRPDTKLEGRQPILDFADGKAAAYEKTLVFGFEKQRTDPVTGNTNVDLLYRGHIFDMNTRVSLMDKPDIEWKHIPPIGKAKFAVLGRQELQQGAVALIIDRTKSMYEVIPDPLGKGKGVIKNDAVVQAVVKVLSELPEGTILSVGTFYGDDKGVVSFEWITGPIKWGIIPAKKQEIINKVKNLQPSDRGDTTPLAEALVRLVEKGDAFNNELVPFRNLVMLTDGADNISGNKRDFTKPGRMVVNALRASDRDVALHLVLFGLGKNQDGDDENVLAEKQFRPIEDVEEFERLDKTPGKVWSGLRSQEKLVEALRDSMLPKVRVLRTATNERLPKDLRISLPEERVRIESPPLEAGTYQLRTFGSRKMLHLEPGDRVLLEMVRGKDQFDLTIPSYASLMTDFPRNLRAVSSDDRVHLTVPKNLLIDRAPNNDLELVATLEKKTQGREEDLRVVRPKFVWFEVKPQTDGENYRPKYLSIANMRERVAPAWDVKLGPWVALPGQANVRAFPAVPRIYSYSLERLPGDAHRVTITKLESLDDEIRSVNKDVTVNGTKVRIDDVRVEDNFLYIAVKHEKDKPVVVRVEGLKKDEQALQLGELHRWYSAADKYTVRFGPIERADFARRTTILFYTLDSLKENASKAIVNADKPDLNVNPRELLPVMKADE